MLGNTRRLRMARSTSPWKSLWNLVVWTRWKSNIQSQKYYLGIPGKRLITSLGIKNIGRSKREKKAMYVITNVSMKNLSKIIKDFEKLPYKGYVWKSPKHELTDSFIYPGRRIDKRFARWTCKNVNYWHATDSNPACLWFRWEQIKRDHCGQKHTASLLYGREQIRKCSCQWNFYGGERIRKRSKKFQQK